MKLKIDTGVVIGAHCLLSYAGPSLIRGGEGSFQKWIFDYQFANVSGNYSKLKFT